MVVQSHQSQPSGIEAPPTRCHAGALAPRGLAAAPAFRLDQGQSRTAGTDAGPGRRLACRVPAHTLEYRTWASKGMAFDLDYPPGATPPDADELASLEPASRFPAICGPSIVSPCWRLHGHRIGHIAELLDRVEVRVATHVGGLGVHHLDLFQVLGDSLDSPLRRTERRQFGGAGIDEGVDAEKTIG